MLNEEIYWINLMLNEEVYWIWVRFFYCLAKGGDQQHFNGSTEWLNNPQFLQIPPQQPGGWAAVPPHSPGNISTEYSAGFSPSPLPASPPGMGGFNQSQFSYEELAAATAGFSQGNLLGQGGFGYVHKGVLTSGKDVAVKSLKTGSGQGEREFQAEVEIISRVHHRHLVSLVGYCIGQGQRMLVYEFVPNKTLEFHLHGTYILCQSGSNKLWYHVLGCHDLINPYVSYFEMWALNIL